MRRVVAGAAGFVLRVDLLRCVTPSFITILGQAASTPAELLGAFALGCVLAGVLPRVAVRFGLPATPTLRAALLVALACRIALMLTDGGQAQLWLASIGVAAAVAWTVLVTEQYGDELVEGFLAALALRSEEQTSEL